MSEPYIGEIRIFGFNFAPRNWATCSGQLLPIQQNTALFSILGTTYGGNGQTTFALPNLSGRAALHPGQGPGLSYSLGQTGGTETVTLNIAQLPAHSHPARCKNADGNDYGPSGVIWAGDAAGLEQYGGTPAGSMAADALTPQGGNQPHENAQPYLTMNYCICMFGIFPSRN